LPLEGIIGTGPGGRIIERDVIEVLKKRPSLTIAAKAEFAHKPQFHIPQEGSGIGGRVTVSDIESYSPALSDDGYTDTPIKGIRKIISDRMLQSLTESAQFTLNASAPVHKLLDIRSEMKSKPGTDLSNVTINDFILFAVSRVIVRFPFINTHKIGNTIRTFQNVHLGHAVDTDRGLMAAVIRNADSLSLAQISSEAKRLTAACRNNEVKPEELTGSTFTVTNLGALGITSFTPVLNLPETAILGVCCIEQKPVNINGIICLEPYIGFSLTINHQAVDGAPAARFLKALCDTIAEIDLLLGE
jgi:pyruvate dehydrogenase E2 component (dihydrolipoamide acetyltransferase)